MDPELGDREEDEAIVVVVSTWGCREDDPLADTVKVSFAVTALGGEGFILTEEDPRSRWTSG
jgi:hypothetical protein